MIEFIATHLQGFLMGAAAIAAGIYALTGFTREASEDGETQIRYQGGRLRRNLAVAGILVGLAASIAIVPKGYVGVVYDLNGGIQQEELPEGLNFVVPIKQHVTNVDVRVKVWEFDDENVYVHTQDFHEIRVPFAINYRISPSGAANVLQNVSGEVGPTILFNSAFTSLRNNVGQIPLLSLAGAVGDINQAVLEDVRIYAGDFDIEVVGFLTRDAIVDAGFTQSVRDKEVSKQNVLKKEQDAQAAIFAATEVRNLADGEAYATLVTGQAEIEVAEGLANVLTREVVCNTLAKAGIKCVPETLVTDGSGSYIFDLSDE